MVGLIEHQQTLTENSTYNQRIKILNILRKQGSITTSEAREILDVMSPAARIMELKNFGYQIETVWEVWIGNSGVKHRIARYVLIRESLISAGVQ